MTDIDTLAATIRAGLDAEAEDAQRATPGPWESVVDHHQRGVVDTSVWSDKLGYYITEKISSGERHIADGRHIARQDPARVLAAVARDRQLLDLLLAEEHHVAEDQWYTCPAATQERDGGTYAETDGGGRCTCGRDARVAAYLAVLAEAYEEGP